MQFKQKMMLKDEITDLAMRIVKAREAKENMEISTETGQKVGSWKVPDVEIMNRGVSEGNRYFDVFNYQRRYGKKHVNPPVLAETLQ
jgi:hypothetical protein